VKILITGVFGQDGTILSKQLSESGHHVTGSYLPKFDDPENHPVIGSAELIALDVTDKDQVGEVLSSIGADSIIHLAGETSVASSWTSPAKTMNSNVLGTTNVLEWVKNHNPQTHFINAASVEVFDSSSSIVSELSPMKASSPYGVSKLATAQLVSAMRADGLHLANVFLSNHESEYRPEKFVMGKIARGVAAIADGKQNSLVLGDISITRDWSSAHDICLGIKLVVEKAYVGDLILASGANHQLSDIVELAFKSVEISNWRDYVQTDQSLLRVNDERVVTYDISAANRVIGWKPVEPVSAWIGKMVQHFREKN
jgi:GDPmannose 4,6-dehydratase